MLIADLELATRIERTVTRLLVECMGAIQKRRPGVAARSWSLAGGAAAIAGPNSPFNKLGGLGLEAALDEGALAEVEAEFQRRGVPLQVELASLADRSILGVLARRGYTPVGCEHVLGRALSREERFPELPDVEVTRGEASDLARFLDVVLQGFAVPDGSTSGPPEEFPREALAADLFDVQSLQGFSHWNATRGGALAGGASLRVCNGVAQLYGAATLLEHRRHGVQTALLHARLHAAALAGADIATVTTQPASKSQRNAERQGFSVLYARTIWQRIA